MKKLLNNINAIIMIGLIGLLLGLSLHHIYISKHILELQQQNEFLMSEAKDVVCKVVKLEEYYYFICDEKIMDSQDL